jgi:hypothetical protein
MSPDTRLSFYMYHKNGRGYATLIETDSLHDEVFLYGFSTPREIKKLINSCEPHQRQQAADFLAEVLPFISPEPGRIA